MLPLGPSSRDHSLPPLDLLQEPEPQAIESEQELLERARQITEKFREFSVDGSVVAIHPGPVVTTFEFKPEAGVKYSKITGMTDDLSLALRAESVRIDRMPGRSTVGIEVPNRRQETIYPRDLFASEKFQHAKARLTLALGKDISGSVFVAELERMPHLLIAGATGSGKSVGLNGMITSILYKSSPAEVRFIMIDTKMIELGIYADIPHLLIPVVTEAKKASNALKWAAREMESRYRKLAALGVRNIAQFNETLERKPDTTMEDAAGGEIPLEKMPYVVIVIDELADLLMVASADVEESIMRLAQMARAVGIHLIIATQRPSVDVITGTIKANFPSRIAFRVSQRVDSRTIIDQQGAEHLLGRGDMLFLSSGSSRLIRVHGGLFTEAELHRITSYLKRAGKPVYDETVLREPEAGAEGGDAGERDEMYETAVRTVVSEGKCSVTLLQRRLQLGYARAARIVDMMEREGVVSPGEGSKPREVLLRPDALESRGA
jgi:S-DNA-T family DNA segregation ATPase FtsK/SpoIIIE